MCRVLQTEDNIAAPLPCSVQHICSGTCISICVACKHLFFDLVATLHSWHVEEGGVHSMYVAFAVPAGHSLCEKA